MTFQDTTTSHETNGKIATGDTKEVREYKKTLAKLCAHKRPHFELMEITPTMALLMLDRNIEHNRKISPGRAAHYAAEMAAGHWGVTSDAIGFDNRGRLINGQHRLVACRQVDRPFTSLVGFGLSEDVFMKVDQGAKRTKGDVFITQGFKHAHMTVAALAFVHGYDNDKISWGGNSWSGLSSAYISPQALLEFAEEHPGITEAATFASHLYHTGGLANRAVLSPSLITGAFYVCSRIDHDDAKDFFERLILGTGLDTTDVIYKCRNRLLTRERSGQPIRNRFKMAYVIKTWNAWRNNEELRYLNWAKDTPFPKAV